MGGEPTFLGGVTGLSTVADKGVGCKEFHESVFFGHCALAY